MRIGFPSRNGGVRPAAVAGMFYTAEAAALVRELDEMLEHTAEVEPAPEFPKLVIVPHAGYIYSGPVAASAYDRLRAARGVVRRVVLLGPVHRVPVRGLALPGATAFDTPLGRVPVDAAAVAAIGDLPQVVESPQAHAMEHALEVQLPFLQHLLGDVGVVPLAVGDASCDEVAQVLERLWGGPETLIVISTDLSHYLAYEQARATDGRTARDILQFDTGISHEQACGATPMSGALAAAKRHGLVAELLDLRNSGDTAGGRGQVVGYGSFAFSGGEARFGPAHGATLLRLAREAIGARVRLNPEPTIPGLPWLRAAQATFVTLKQGPALRGCVGSLEMRRALGEDVIANARRAAFEDPRFAPLAPQEFPQVQLEVSILSAPKRILFEDHADLIRQLRPGTDGVILECEGHSATFLPQVWDGLPDPEQFVAQLRHKAGIPDSVRTARCKALRYVALKWREEPVENGPGQGAGGE